MSLKEQRRLRLADHFPLIRKECKKQATDFFTCFSEKGDQPPEAVSGTCICLFQQTCKLVLAMPLLFGDVFAILCADVAVSSVRLLLQTAAVCLLVVACSPVPTDIR